MSLITEWKISDEFWAKVEPLIPAAERPASKKYRRATGGGRKPVEARKILSAILYVLHSRIAWKALPNHLGSTPTVHRHFKLWQESGFFSKLHRAKFDDPEIQEIDWERAEGKRLASRPKSEISKPPRSFSSLEYSEREVRISDPRIQTLLLRLHGTTDALSFWSALQSLFRESIPHNSIVTYIDFFDHPNTWMATKILTTTNANMPLEWFEKRWKLDITPHFLQSHPGIKYFRFSDIVPDPKTFWRTDFFQQFFKPFGWHYMASMAFWHESGLNSSIAFRRTQDQGDYRPGEIELLKKLHPHIETVLKRILPSHKEQRKARWLEEFGQYLPFPVLLLDWTFEQVYVNREALEQCTIWNFGPNEARAYDPRAVFRTPTDILESCKKLKAEWIQENIAERNSEGQRVLSRVVQFDSPGYSATITIQTNSKGLIARPGFLIYFDRPKLTHRAPAGQGDKTISWTLTTAERSLAQLVAEGYDNKAIALKLHKSTNTVRNQLTSIYSKMGVAGQREQLANSI